MKVIRMGAPGVVMENPSGKHNYFAWPTVARLKNGRIAVAASGFRLEHVCPFGKAVMSISEDEGRTFAPPAVVIDTVLDDRDAGLAPFGTSGLILTSFNNTVAFQREAACRVGGGYIPAYLDNVTPPEEACALGATFRISHDNGVTFGPILHSPVTSPHGPIQLRDGTVLWVGRIFRANEHPQEEDYLAACALDTDTGKMTLRGKIAPAVADDGRRLLSCEPYALELPDGTLICHIRVHRDTPPMMTIYQCTSTDGGRSWSAPRQVEGVDDCSAPAHLLLHSSGVLLSVYGHRKPPLGVQVMFSRDGGRSWDAGHMLYENSATPDLGYPATVELADGSLLTVFYAHEHAGAPAVIWQQHWRMEP